MPIEPVRLLTCKSTLQPSVSQGCLSGVSSREQDGRKRQGAWWRTGWRRRGKYPGSESQLLIVYLPRSIISKMNMRTIPRASPIFIIIHDNRVIALNATQCHSYPSLWSHRRVGFTFFPPTPPPRLNLWPLLGLRLYPTSHNSEN